RFNPLSWWRYFTHRNFSALFRNSDDCGG
ncbi:PTS HPr component phosphorylation site family protein, partial [Vibrio harveyi]